MTFGIGNLVALICIVISIIFAIITHQATNALWWALLAIFAVLWWDARAPSGKGQPTLLRSSVFLVIPRRVACLSPPQHPSDRDDGQRESGQHAAKPAIVGLDCFGLGLPTSGQDLLGYRFFPLIEATVR